MTLAVVIIVVLLAVLGFGYLIFRIMRKSQDQVPGVAAAHAARHAQVGGTDEEGRPILDADEPNSPPSDGGAFESILRDEIRERGMQQPPDDEA